MSQLGQSRRFRDGPATSALPLIADLGRNDEHFRKVPAPEVIRFPWDLLCFLDATVGLDLG